MGCKWPWNGGPDSKFLKKNKTKGVKLPYILIPYVKCDNVIAFNKGISMIVFLAARKGH